VSADAVLQRARIDIEPQAHAALLSRRQVRRCVSLRWVDVIDGFRLNDHLTVDDQIPSGGIEMLE
jgi:hypothetical protein